MAGTDVKLDEGPQGNYVTIEAAVVKTTAADLVLDAMGRRSRQGGHRRALVHDQSDGLTINFMGDYPGGLRLVDVSEILPQVEDGNLVRPQLGRRPSLAVRGGITFEQFTLGPDLQMQSTTVSLAEELERLRDQIAALTQRVATLEAR